MAHKTEVKAEDNSQRVLVTRTFGLPVDLLFMAYTEAEIVEQWMGTKVIKLDCRDHGSYRFETTDPKGNKHRFHGVIHGITENRNITRTFEMENTPFPVQLEFLDFEAIDADTSRLTMCIICKSVEHRNQMMQLPFAQGINMAHNRLQEVVSKRIKA